MDFGFGMTQFAAMTTKIKVAVTINPLKITMKDEHGSEETSNLHDQSAPKRQRPQRGLVVKVSDGGTHPVNEPNQLNLELCARRFINANHDKDSVSVHHSSKKSIHNHFGSNTTEDNNLTFSNHHPYYDSNVIENVSTQFDVDKNVNVISQFLTPESLLKPANCKFTKISNSKESSTIAVDFLEKNLKKVHENNQQIQRNLYALNIALNYTMKKEMLEKVCSKTEIIFPWKMEYERDAVQQIGGRKAVQGWQMVWTCSACYQVWPRRDLLMLHSVRCISQSQEEYIQPTKVLMIMQCEFCEKVFANSTHLLIHSLTHTTARNYECGVCYVGFPTYLEIQQHWRRCKFLIRSYEFTLPKMRLCNMCDNVFREYQQLYDHRYKAGHFFFKIHNNKANNAEICVYQCELCAECFPSVSHLLLHRHSLHTNIVESSQ